MSYDFSYLEIPVVLLGSSLKERIVQLRSETELSCCDKMMKILQNIDIHEDV